MATTRQVAANKLNAQLSTGPKSDLGKARVAGNALRHGLFAYRILVPELGEEQAAWDAYTHQVVNELEPVGVVEQRLATRVAELLWRLDRIGRAESAITATAVAGALLPDPATVAPEAVKTLTTPLPADASASQRLARCRAAIPRLRRDLVEAERLTELVRTLDRRPAAEVLDGIGLKLVGAIRRALDWLPDLVNARLAIILEAAGQPQVAPWCAVWTGELLTKTLTVIAEVNGVSVVDLRNRVVEEMARNAATLAQQICGLEAEEIQLVATLETERACAAAAAVLVTDGRADLVMRSEAHVMRQLDATLRQLHALQARRGTSENRCRALASEWVRSSVMPAAALRIGFVP